MARADHRVQHKPADDVRREHAREPKLGSRNLAHDSSNPSKVSHERQQTSNQVRFRDDGIRDTRRGRGCRRPRRQRAVLKLRLRRGRGRQLLSWRAFRDGGNLAALWRFGRRGQEGVVMLQRDVAQALHVKVEARDGHQRVEVHVLVARDRTRYGVERHETHVVERVVFAVAEALVESKHGQVLDVRVVVHAVHSHVVNVVRALPPVNVDAVEQIPHDDAKPEF
mmetsp:Transcript_9131/g.24521  ORF Transcript_9131/g.24521 Transcript_9131/m.24521 type:complete len:224 (+) Transcript_9131:500-1171(+)